MALSLSAWGPLVTGLAMLLTNSTTQIADFVRRSAELVALATTWAVFRRLGRQPDASRELVTRLELRAARTVAAALMVSGAVTLLLVATRLREFTPSGDVRLGLAIATLGLITNSIFWRRYAGLERERPGALLGAQRRLYRAKVAVDAAVMLALASVLVAPEHALTRWLDLGGSLAVAAYLLGSAWRQWSLGRGQRH